MAGLTGAFASPSSNRRSGWRARDTTAASPWVPAVTATCWRSWQRAAQTACAIPRSGDADGPFASGGRRRSEIAGLHCERLAVGAPSSSRPTSSLACDPSWPHKPPAPIEEVVYLTGRPVEALNAWLAVSKIDKGSVFGPSISRAMFPSTERSLSMISSSNGRRSRVWIRGVSAHGLRSGYLTEAANRGVPLPGPWSRHAIARAAGREAIATVQPDAAGGQRDFFEDQSGPKRVYQPRSATEAMGSLAFIIGVVIDLQMASL